MPRATHGLKTARTYARGDKVTKRPTWRMPQLREKFPKRLLRITSIVKKRVLRRAA
jgi:hypothetical protein